MATTTPVGTLYRGGGGMWTWVLHRITGVSVFFFLEVIVRILEVVVLFVLVVIFVFVLVVLFVVEG